MLVLTRRKDQKVLFPNLGIAVEVVEVRGNAVRLGIRAPRDVRIVRDELDFYPQAPAPKDPAPDPSLLATETLRRQLDAANLALHLAQNQMRQGLPDLAEVALNQALECLQTVDESLVANTQDEFKTPSNNELAIHETRSSYATSQSNSSIGLVFCGQPDQRQLVSKHLRKLGHKIVYQTSVTDLIQWLLENPQPDFALMICDSDPSLDASNDLAIGFGENLQRMKAPVKLAGVNAIQWQSKDCIIDLAT